jgi:eukaryotic-like serine/threonine-protein kinase
MMIANSATTTLRTHAGRAMIACLWAASLLGWVALADAADWPMARGNPGLTGVAGGPLSTNLTLKWTAKTGDAIKGAAAVAGDTVFVGSYDKKLYALDLKSGEKRWEFAAEDAIESTPLVLAGRVFIGDLRGNFYALDATTGKSNWVFTTGDKIVGGANWIAGPDGRPQSILVGSHDFFLYSLDPTTGQTNWAYETANYINGSPAVAQGKTVFGGCDAVLHVVGLEKGEKLKEVEAGAYIMGSVALDGNVAFFGHYDNEVWAVDIEKFPLLLLARRECRPRGAGWARPARALPRQTNG